MSMVLCKTPEQHIEDFVKANEATIIPFGAPIPNYHEVSTYILFNGDIIILPVGTYHGTATRDYYSYFYKQVSGGKIHCPNLQSKWQDLKYGTSIDYEMMDKLFDGAIRVFKSGNYVEVDCFRELNHKVLDTLVRFAKYANDFWINIPDEDEISFVGSAENLYKKLLNNKDEDTSPERKKQLAIFQELLDQTPKEKPQVPAKPWSASAPLSAIEKFKNVITPIERNYRKTEASSAKFDVKDFVESITRLVPATAYYKLGESFNTDRRFWSFFVLEDGSVIQSSKNHGPTISQWLDELKWDGSAQISQFFKKHLYDSQGYFCYKLLHEAFGIQRVYIETGGHFVATLYSPITDDQFKAMIKIFQAFKSHYWSFNLDGYYREGTGFISFLEELNTPMANEVKDAERKKELEVFKGLLDQTPKEKPQVPARPWSARLPLEIIQKMKHKPIPIERKYKITQSNTTLNNLIVCAKKLDNLGLYRHAEMLDKIVMSGYLDPKDLPETDDEDFYGRRRKQREKRIQALIDEINEMIKNREQYPGASKFKENVDLENLIG